MKTLFFLLSMVCMMTTNARGAIKMETVEYKVGDRVFEGMIAYDDAGAEKRPGVVVCHEWWGCNDYAKDRAKQLASLGYIAFALDMYGKGVTTDDPKKAGELSGKLYSDPKVAREIAAAGMKVLTSHKLCDAKKVAAIGYCMGGTVALELARTGTNLSAVVCFHTSTIAAKDPADNAKIKAKVLVCNGADDTFVTPEQIADFQLQMREAKIDYQFVQYGGAVHSFTNPGADKFKIDGVKYNEKADKRSWELMKGWFKEAFGK